MEYGVPDRPGPYLTFLSGKGGEGANQLLSDVENMAALQLFTPGGSWGMVPVEILVVLGVLRPILRHTELLDKWVIGWLILIIIVY